MRAEGGERGGSSTMRWKTVPQMSGCDRKHTVADSGQTSKLSRTSKDIDQAEQSRCLALVLEHLETYTTYNCQANSFSCQTVWHFLSSNVLPHIINR